MKIKEKNGKFIITDFNALEAYKIATKIEKDGIFFYKKILNKIDEKNKDTLKFLIEEENKHLKLFSNLLSDLRQNIEDNFEEDDILESLDYGIFMPYQTIDDLEKILDDNKKILRLGIQIEEKSINFYKSCLEQTKSKETAEQLQKIIKEEQNHKKLLENILSSS